RPIRILGVLGAPGGKTKQFFTRSQGEHLTMVRAPACASLRASGQEESLSDRTGDARVRYGGERRPRSAARATAWARFSAPSLVKMAVTWNFTVRSEIESASAIWRLERPAATKRNTPRSRALSRPVRRL